MALIISYLRFDGNAQEAFDFYKSIFGGELSVVTVVDSEMAKMLPDKKDKIFHAQLKKGNLLLLGSDLGPDEGLQRGNTTVLTLECSSSEDANSLFDKLAKGGKVG